MRDHEPATLCDELRVGRAERAATRLLAGEGSASLTAYHLDGRPTLSAIAHGLSRTGEILVATTADHIGSKETGSGAVDVRLDVRREAPELEVRIVAATAHLLGILHWLPDGWQSGTAREQLPDHIADIALAPGGRLGVVRAESLLVHEAAGVTRVATASITAERAARESSRPRSTAPDLLNVSMTTDRMQLSILAHEVMTGYRRGCVLSEKPTPPVCGEMLNRTFLVDVDSDGITLMHVDERQTTVVLALFDQESHSGEHISTADRRRVGLARLLSA